jgi:hypothetical protein
MCFVLLRRQGGLQELHSKTFPEWISNPEPASRTECSWKSAEGLKLPQLITCDFHQGP